MQDNVGHANPAGWAYNERGKNVVPTSVVNEKVDEVSCQGGGDH